METLDNNKFEKFEKLTQEIMEENKARGIAVRAFRKSGEIIYEKYFGFKNEEKKELIDENTIFGIASITKSFVALSILQLLEQGKLSLEDHISKYIPYFKNTNIHYPILIKHLLSHTPGFYPMKRTTIENVIKIFPAEDTLENEIIYNNEFSEESLKIICEQLNKETEFIGRPGEYISYFNDGYGILSEIVHKITDIPFAKYVENNILKPLNMDRTNLSYIKNCFDDNCSTLYSIKDEKVTSDMNFKNNAFALCGAGAIKSTIADLTKYILMFLCEGKTKENKIIDRFFLKEMLKPRIFITHNSYYCYGVQISEIDNRRYINHSGGLPGVSSCFSFCPEEQIGIIILCNTEDVSVNVLNKALFNIIIGKDEIIDKPKLNKINWDKDSEEQVQGEYITVEEEGEDFIIEKKDDNSFWMKRYGKEKELIPVFENEGIVKGKLTDNFIIFLRNQENKIFAAKYGTNVYKKVLKI